MKRSHLLLTLNTFSATGGIEKVCRIAAKALHEITEENGDDVRVFSMYDKAGVVDASYIPANQFKGFNGRRISFIANALARGIKSDTIILSHINLLLVGYLIKLFSPRSRLILFAHGIEVWDVLPGWKKKMLQAVDLYLPVSRFTAMKLEQVQGIPASKIQVLNNCIDPFLKDKKDTARENYFKAKYKIDQGDFVLFTLARLKYTEQYKGYDKVIEAIAEIQDNQTPIKYLIAGRYDEEEKLRLEKVIESRNLSDRVIFTGFVADEDLPSLFHLSDVYIMPSRGEGFGVVFIEALYYGKPVIAGNLDGSVDALDNGRFGILVNPVNNQEICAAIQETMINKHLYIPHVRNVIDRFGFENYKLSLKKKLGLVTKPDHLLKPHAN